MYLILGKQGQLGQSFTQFLKEQNIPFAAPEEKSADILDISALRSLVKKYEPSAIINCAAYTDVEGAEQNEEPAYALNVRGPENMGKVCAERGITAVHFSTDYVFSGDACVPYHEQDAARPLNVYGRTKLWGEQALMQSGAYCLILRTSWLYSSFGRNFYALMRRLGSEKSSIDVVSDQTGTPTYAGNLVRYSLQILSRFDPEQSGVYHIGDEGTASWYDFAYAVMHEENLSCRVNPTDSASYPSKAVRPSFSVLSKDKVKRTFNLRLHHWRQGVALCRQAFEKIS